MCRAFLCVAPLILLALGACIGADATPLVRAQAAHDLVCPEASLRVERGMDGYYAASGCGKRQRYLALCEGTRCSVSQAGTPAQSPASRGPGSDPSEPREAR